jgi:hypothetical protein
MEKVSEVQVKEGAMSAKERLLKTLFEDPKREHANIKFCRGNAEAIPEEEFCAQINTVLFESENGLLDPQDGFPEQLRQVDVRNLSFPG